MKKVLLFVVIGLLLIAIPATIYFVGQQRDLRAKAAPATTLSLTPAQQTANVGDTIKLNVNINPGSNQVISARIHVTFDPSKLTAESITNGANAPRVLNAGVVASGSATITVAAASNAQPIASSGTIAILTLTALSPSTAIAPADVSFASDTFAGALSEPDTNVLIGTTASKITISGPDITPTLEPTETATPTATLTPTLTPTEGATNSAEATSSAITILSPAENASTTSAQPVIQVKAPPGSTVTIVIHSDPQTCIAVADENGIATCIPETALDIGPHDITASIQNDSGGTDVASDSFVVVAAGESGASSESAMPISGSVETTILLIAVGVLLLGSGSLLWLF